VENLNSRATSPLAVIARLFVVSLEADTGKMEMAAS
jgi:hypothetical protein